MRRDGTMHLGERSHLSRLTTDQVLQLREDRKNGVPVKDIAAGLNVHVQTIYSVLSGASWKWLK